MYIPNPVMNRMMVNEMYSGIKELSITPPATMISAIKVDFFLPILSDKQPNMYDETKFELMKMLLANATYDRYIQFKIDAITNMI